MNCPKCGHEQEERLDCKKCGVVFTKFYALYPQQGATAPLAESAEVMELTEISRLIRDLSRRFNEFEFERAERTRLRGDLRILDQKVESGLKELGDRISGSSGQNTATFAPRTESGAETEHFDQTLGPLQSRLQHLEAQLEAALANKSGGQEDSENQRRIDARLASLDGRISNLQAQAAQAAVDPRLDFENITKELAGMQSSIQNVMARLTSLDDRISSLQSESAQAKGEPQVELDKFTKELAATQTSLQNVTVRYSEIGELKKNHLVLSNSVDAILRDLALLKDDSSKGATKKIAEFDKELTALRAEVRQMLKDRQDLPPLEVDVHSIRENLEEIRRFMSSLSQKL
jgi:chromosome segregation ATPase